MAPGLAYASWRQDAFSRVAARAQVADLQGSSSSEKTSDKGRNLSVAISLNRRQAELKEDGDEKPETRPGRDHSGSSPDTPAKDGQPQPEGPRPAPDEVDTKPEPTQNDPQPNPSAGVPETQPERPAETARPDPTTEEVEKPTTSVGVPSPVEEPTAPPITTPLAPVPTTTRRGGLLDGITGGLGDVVGGITSALLPGPPPTPQTSEFAAPVTSRAPAPAPSPPVRPGLGDILDGIIPPVLAPITSVVGEILPTQVRPPSPPPAESSPAAPAPPAPPAPGGGIISQILGPILPSGIPIPNIPSLPEVITSIIAPQPTPSGVAPPPVLPPVLPSDIIPPILPSALPPIIPSALPPILPPVLPSSALPILPSRPLIVAPSVIIPDIITSAVVPQPAPTTVVPIQPSSRLPVGVPVVSAPAGNDAPVVALPPASSAIVSASSISVVRPSVTRSSVAASSSRAPGPAGPGIILAQEGPAIETGAASIEVTTVIPTTSVSTGTVVETSNGSTTTRTIKSTSVAEVTTVTTIPNPSRAPEAVSATGGSSNPAVMGGAIGGAIVVILGILVAVFLFRRRRQNSVRFSRSISPEDGFGGSSEPKSYLTVPPTRHSPRERKTEFTPYDQPKTFSPEMSQSQVLGPAQYSYDFTLPSRNITENPFLDQPGQPAPPMVTVTPPGGEYVTPAPIDPFALAPAPASMPASENTRTLVAPANGVSVSETRNPFADPVLPPIQRSTPLMSPAMLSTDEKDPFEDPSVPTKYLKFSKGDAMLERESVSTAAIGKRDTLATVRTDADNKRDSVASTAFTEDGKVMIDAM